MLVLDVVCDYGDILLQVFMDQQTWGDLLGISKNVMLLVDILLLVSVM